MRLAVCDLLDSLGSSDDGQAALSSSPPPSAPSPAAAASANVADVATPISSNGSDGGEPHGPVLLAGDALFSAADLASDDDEAWLDVDEEAVDAILSKRAAPAEAAEGGDGGGEDDDSEEEEEEEDGDEGSGARKEGSDDGGEI